MMLKIFNLFSGMEFKESASDTPDEVEFACIYFAFYPYLTANA